jgi:hypothetical protein
MNSKNRPITLAGGWLERSDLVSDRPWVPPKCRSASPRLKNLKILFQLGGWLKYIDRCQRIDDSSPEGLFCLILCCKYNDPVWGLIMYSTMVSKSMIAYHLVLTTMSIEISILFKIFKNSLAIRVYICILIVHSFFLYIYFNF